MWAIEKRYNFEVYILDLQEIYSVKKYEELLLQLLKS